MPPSYPGSVVLGRSLPPCEPCFLNILQGCSDSRDAEDSSQAEGQHMVGVKLHRPTLHLGFTKYLFFFPPSTESADCLLHSKKERFNRFDICYLNFTHET